MSDQPSRPTINVKAELRQTLHVPHFNTAVGEVDGDRVTITLEHKDRPPMIEGVNVLGGDPVAVMKTDLAGVRALREALDDVLRQAGAI